MADPLLESVMKKQGVTPENMDDDEKKTFDNWRKILADGDITVDKIVEFCRAQLKLIEAQWSNLENLEKKNERLVMQHAVYSALLRAIEAPQHARAALEKHLRDLIAS